MKADVVLLVLLGLLFFGFGVCFGQVSVVHFNSEWNAKPLTLKQQQWLIDSGFDTALLTVSEQRTILNNLINRKVRNLATPKQIKVLRRYGYKTKNLSFNDASSMIDKLAKNNWRRI